LESRPHFRARRALLLVLLIVTSLYAFGCEEASFVLAPESRLPRWFTLPKGLMRAKVTVNETDYLDNSIFTLYDITGSSWWAPEGHKLAQVSAVRQGAISLTEKRNVEGGFDGNPYPLYEVATVNGITEVLEYKRMEPVFYLNDDPEIRAALGLPRTSRFSE
jgi:hypothetical protein